MRRRFDDPDASFDREFPAYRGDVGDRWARIEEIFHAATARAEAERPAVVAKACGDDEALRREVDELLRADQQSEAAVRSDRRAWDLLSTAPDNAARLASMIGARLGPYHVLALLGAGGMGEVYRARDTRLGRDVAVKVLPQAFSADADRVSRFEREARVLASLNHPNIATIHGIEESSGVCALVMELVDGPTLQERLREGPLSIAAALPLARQIAAALAAAHEKGIVHRDLKPANIKLAPGGVVKVLDFGLAKALRDDVDGDVSDRVTIDHATREGMIVGTAPYMSPEQARGLAIDRRTDVWAFGCVLYEMLTGRPAFTGASTTDILAAVVNTEPDWDRLPPETSPAIRRLLARSLEKDPAWRLSDMAMVRVELRDAESEPRLARPSGSPAPRRFSAWLPLVPYVALLAALLTAVMVWRIPRTSGVPRPLLRFSVDLPSPALVGGGANPIAISPDGTRLAYYANRRFFLRALDQLEVVEVRGIAASRMPVQNPVFSPDNAWVAYWHEGHLLKVSFNGGVPTKICDAPLTPHGASWGSDNEILVGGGTDGILRVAADGAVMKPLISVNPGEFASSPQLLPGGEWVLFVVTVGRDWDQGQVVVQSLKSGVRRPLKTSARTVQYLPSGYLVFGRGTALMAQAFDARQLTLKGNPVPMIDGVLLGQAGGPAMFFALSPSGTLAHIPARTTAMSTRLVQVTRTGARSDLVTNQGMTWYPRFSPDGNRVAFGLSANDTGMDSDVWVLDVSRPAAQWRITSTGDNKYFPTWSHDGRRVAFADGAGRTHRVLWTLADGSGGTETLIPDGQYFPTSWSRDGKVLAVYGVSAAASRDLAMLHMDGEKPTLSAFVQTEFQERDPIFSKDGDWVAYVSDKSGRDEIYARRASGDGGDVIVSTGGGGEPVWSKSGPELFYRHDGKLLVVRVEASPASLVVSAPSILFTDPYRLDTSAGRASVANYDISPDGTRFLMVEEAAIGNAASQIDKIQLIVNWDEELKRRVQ
jgi:serine/threonine-protein kinase